MDFLKSYWWILLLAILAAMGLVVWLIWLFRHAKGGGKKKLAPLSEQSTYLEALGGKDNVKSHSLTGSRISVELLDYQKANPEALLSAGIDSYIKMSGRLILIVKDRAEEVYRRIFG